jgi:argininosuccinate lyase
MQKVDTESTPAPAAPESGHRLWGGRFAGGPAPALDELNRSLPVDRRLWREDIEASRAWVQALARADVLEAEEARTLDAGLRAVAGRLGADPSLFQADDEDIHTLVERLLYEEVGTVAGKLHTGRSRNDQVATDARLWAMRALGVVATELQGLQSALVQQAAATIDVLMPSYTHLRRAQPVRVAHWLLAHFWALERDRQRLLGALERVAVLPLGSGAIAGCGFPVDRTLLKELLGFRSVSENSLDAVGDRDWIIETIFVASMIGTHLSRLAEDLIVFSTQEFGFVEHGGSAHRRAHRSARDGEVRAERLQQGSAGGQAPPVLRDRWPARPAAGDARDGRPARLPRAAAGRCGC